MKYKVYLDNDQSLQATKNNFIVVEMGDKNRMIAISGLNSRKTLTKKMVELAKLRQHEEYVLNGDVDCSMSILYSLKFLWEVELW